MKTIRLMQMALVLSAALFFSSLPVQAAAVSAHAAVLMEASSGEILYEKNAYEKLPMASTTKIMTAVTALEHASPAQIIRIDEQACGVEGSSVYLTPGETWSLEQLLYALMLESANDAAAAIAIGVAGSIETFADWMNETAQALGLHDSHFTNPHGLDDEQHYTTAADLARLTAYALQNPTFRTLVASKRYTMPGKNGEGERIFVNHNRLLRENPEVIGVKTGFTKRSGRCLVTAAERDGVTVIAVTLRAPDDWNDHTSLYEEGFAACSAVSLAVPGEFQIEVPCTGSPGGTMTLVNRDALTVCLKNGTEVTHTVSCPHLLFPPVQQGDVCADLLFYAGDRLLGSLPLYAAASAGEIPVKHPFLEKFILKK